MAWFFIALAGFFEIGWIYSLKGMDGFTKLFPFVIFYLMCGLGAAFFLSLALKNLPGLNSRYLAQNSDLLLIR